MADKVGNYALWFAMSYDRQTVVPFAGMMQCRCCSR